MTPALTPRERFACERYYHPAFGGQTDAQIAASAGVSRAAIAQRRRRALAKLPESLARQLRRGPAQPHVSQLSACQ